MNNMSLFVILFQVYIQQMGRFIKIYFMSTQKYFAAQETKLPIMIRSKIKTLMWVSQAVEKYRYKR